MLTHEEKLEKIKEWFRGMDFDAAEVDLVAKRIRIQRTINLKMSQPTIVCIPVKLGFEL